eukprot:m.494946 g.494946  ORF g.494946 m.494946 type:complete len:203 (-) comp42424_c0_seq1:228-836(-)
MSGNLLPLLNALCTKPQFHGILSIIKGFRNGVVYGAKVRAPHAFVMTFLWKRGPLLTLLKGIARATFQHSRNLAMFVALYKSLLAAGRSAGATLAPASFVAAGLAGATVFGENNPINMQINLYLLSRVMAALVRVLDQRGMFSALSSPVWFRLFGAGVWAFALCLFEMRPETLQKSLQSSMEYLYHDSETWKDLRTLLWHNK